VLTRGQKQEQVAELIEKFDRATCIYVADYRGVDVESVNGLRRRIRSEGDGACEYRVAKNNVLLRAAEGSSAKSLRECIDGPTAVAIGYGDPASLAKILVDFSKEHEVFSLRAGVVEGRAVDSGEIGVLATLPSLDELRGTLAGLLLAPATKLVRLFSEPGRQIARVLNARGAQQE
jgi:large subunit ribosomal protein L10